MRSAIQHFAAGAVLAAVAANVIPEVERTGTLAGIVSGFAAGGLLMIGMKWLIVRYENQGKQKSRIPLGRTAAAAVDTLIDSALTSAGFSANQQLGVLLAAALALELFFLDVCRWSLWRKFFLAEASGATLAIVLAFGAAALIYLVAEELLVENVEAEQSIVPTMTLFSGFLALLVLKLLE